ncbi:restriction endonuclease subunit S [Candidatus Uhrbacteria bacterium]|nr:restriction endonuclease subunit S [Candidatus Uhrbacteria bacterium]
MQNTPSKKIPSDWKTMKMGDLFDFKNGVNADKTQYGSGTRFINVMEVIKHSSLTSELIPGMVAVDAKTLAKNRVKYGDVLFNRTSETPEEIGLSSIYLDNEEVIFGGFVIRARSKTKDLDDCFKKYCFSSSEVRGEIIKRGQGAVRSNIGQEDLRDVYILIPPVDEQARIVTVLEAWDSAIEKLSKKIDLKKMIQNGLCQQLLHGKIRLRNFSKQWNLSRLADLFKERKEIGRGDLPLLSIAARKGIIYQANSYKKDSSNTDKSKYKRICPGDIGYNTMRMWQGRSALSKYDGIVSPAYTVVSPRKDVDPLFFAYLFKTPRLIHSFYQNSQGIVSDTLNCKYKDFKLVKCPVPAYEEQVAIGKILALAEEELEILERKLKALKFQKKFLLNNLVTGKIRTTEFIKVNP